jgi:hypothetical protein
MASTKLMAYSFYALAACVGRQTLRRLKKPTKDNGIGVLIAIATILVGAGQNGWSFSAIWTNLIGAVVLPCALVFCLLCVWHLFQAAKDCGRTEKIPFANARGDTTARLPWSFRWRRCCVVGLYLLVPVAFSMWALARIRGLPTSPPQQFSFPTQPFSFADALPDKVTVLLDNGASLHLVVNLPTAELEKGPYTGLLQLDGGSPLSVYVKDGMLMLDASLFDKAGNRVIYLKANKIQVVPPDWDRNFSNNAVEVVDVNHVPVFQMIRERSNIIRIAGLFIGSRGSRIDARPAKALFKYPSWKYPGQYAEP